MLWWAVLMSVPALMACVQAWVEPTPEGILRGKRLLLSVFGIAIMAFSVVIVMHAKQQIVTDRDRLVPTRAPQLLMMCVSVMLVGIVLPLVGMVANDQPLLPSAAILLVMMAMVVWWAHTQSMILTIILLALMFLWKSPIGAGVTASLENGQWPVTVAGMIVGGTIGLVALVYRIATMTEDSWEYHRDWRSGRWDHESRMTGQHPQVWRTHGRSILRNCFEPPRYLLERAMTRPARTLWDCIQRRRIGVTFGGWVVVAFMMVCWMILVLVATPKSAQLTGMLVLWLIIIPPAMAFQRVRSSRLMLGVEMMRPTSRGACLTEVGLALSMEVMRMWLIVAIVCAIILIAWHGTLRLATTTWLIIAATGAAQVVLAAVGLWFLRFRRVLPALMAFCLIMWQLGVGAGMLWYWRDEMHPAAIVGIIVMLLLIGAFVARDAHRRWMYTDVA
jgi:hypothetical protein